tara:strand:+ start:200 stop:1480 length:1281 start_codon:yes stop_codon:yes gene_type:complete
MGFFKKLGKKMRGFFKRIGKGIKKGIAKFGKFMGKIGILGQIAMMFILPGIGSMMLKGLGAMTGLTATAGSAAAAAGGIGTASGFTAAAAGSSSVIAKGVAWTLKTAQRFANSPLLKPFKTVTDAVSGFMENTAKFVGNQVGLGKIKPGSKFANYFNDAPAEFFGKGENTVLGRVGKSVTDNWSSFKDDIAAGDIFMSGDKDLSLTKAYDKGLAEKAKTDSFYNNQGQASIDGVPVDEMFAINTTNDKLDPLLKNLADTRANISASNKVDLTNANNFDVLDEINEGITRTTPKEGFFDKMGENLKEKFITGEDSFAQSLRPVNMLGNIGESIVKAPATMVQQSLLAPLMDRGGQQASGWYSNAGPTYNPGRDRAEQYAYSTSMASADATSQVFGSDYDYFTASQADQYGVDVGGTWGNYMGNQRVA